MESGSFRFDRFLLDPRDRRLVRGDAPVDLNGRYLDALALLVRERGRLVSKDRFLEEVWRGVPVTDEALTQCIRTLRRQLGDDAAKPRFIETVPKHGYRFIAPVECVDDGAPRHPAAAAQFAWREFLLLGAAGTVGGGVAGLFGGLFYGFGTAAQPPGVGAVSGLLVLICVNILVGLLGGAGVGFGIAAGGVVGRSWPASLVGGAAGGLLVGAFVKLVGLDAFNLLLGRSPGDITGAAEGALLGGAIGFGAWLGGLGAGPRALRRRVAAAGLAGAAAGVLIAALGGRLMGGSLDQLARGFPDSRLRLDPIGSLVGESGFGPATQLVTAGLEGLAFGACVVAAMGLARRRLREDASDRG